MGRGRSVPWFQGQGPVGSSVVSGELSGTRGTNENRLLPTRQSPGELSGSGSCGVTDGGSDTTPTTCFKQNQGNPRLTDDTSSLDCALRGLGFGLVVPSNNVWNKQCGFPLGVVPLAPGHLEIPVTNHSSEHVVIPRGTVIGYVHPTSLDDLGLPCDDCAEHVMVLSHF